MIVIISTSGRSLALSAFAATRSFSVSAIRPSRRQVLVELLDDVQGLGQIYDRMIMHPGRARNALVPNGLARIVPWKRNSDRASEVGSDKLTLRAARIRSTAQTAAAWNNATSPLSTEATHTAATPKSTIEALNNLPPSLDFFRRTTSSTSDAIHGSLTLADIATRLQDEHGLSNQDIEVLWGNTMMEESGRIRILGTFDALVRVRGFGMEEAPIVINIIALQE